MPRIHLQAVATRCRQVAGAVVVLFLRVLRRRWVIWWYTSAQLVPDSVGMFGGPTVSGFVCVPTLDCKVVQTWDSI